MTSAPDFDHDLRGLSRARPVESAWLTALVAHRPPPFSASPSARELRKRMSPQAQPPAIVELRRINTKAGFPYDLRYRYSINCPACRQPPQPSCRTRTRLAPTLHPLKTCDFTFTAGAAGADPQSGRDHPQTDALLHPPFARPLTRSARAHGPRRAESCCDRRFPMTHRVPCGRKRQPSNLKKTAVGNPAARRENFETAMRSPLRNPIPKEPHPSNPWGERRGGEITRRNNNSRRSVVADRRY